MNTVHTAWCGRGHHCNLREHRSTPLTYPNEYGGIVACLVSTQDTTTAFLELRISVPIPTDQSRARLRAHLIAVELGQALTTAIVQADITAALAADPTPHALTRRKESTP